MVRKYGISFVLLLLILICSVSVLAVEPAIMTLDEIKPGMNGYGRTVFNGYEVEKFPVKIINVLEEEGAGQDLILIRAGGEKIDKIGGIAAGMSGSPVYVDEKLIGAVGYGWQYSDHHYGLVTPIESMLALLDGEKKENSLLLDEVSRFQTPLMVSGMRGRALERFSQEMAEYGFRVVPGAGLKEEELEKLHLEPGSAIAVQLVRGDVNVASLGTLTYNDGKNILAFGHSFMNKGEVDYLFSRAYVNGIIPSLQQPFKLGTPDKNVLGSIKVDRGAGIAGKLGDFPRIIPFKITVVDQERNIKQEVKVQLVKDEELLTSLIINVALQAIDETLDRIGNGTARVKYKILGNGLPDLSIQRENLFFSRRDIAAMALGDLYYFLDLLVSNPFQKVNFIDIRLDVEIDNVNKVALVQEAKILNDEVKPGDELQVEVTLHPYRKDPFKKVVTVMIPEDIQPGMATVMIDGGFTGTSQLPSPEEEQETEMNQAIIEGYKDFDSIIDDYLNKPKNNDLIIQVFPSYPVSNFSHNQNQGEKSEETEENEGEEVEDKPAAKNINENVEQPEIKETIATDYVLEGSLNLDIEIKGDQADKKKKM